MASEMSVLNRVREHSGLFISKPCQAVPCHAMPCYRARMQPQIMHYVGKQIDDDTHLPIHPSISQPAIDLIRDDALRKGVPVTTRLRDARRDLAGGPDDLVGLEDHLREEARRR
ncbi:hypothetical protein CHU98_g12098, partial [Xylaria longipes]